MIANLSEKLWPADFESDPPRRVVLVVNGYRNGKPLEQTVPRCHFVVFPPDGEEDYSMDMPSARTTQTDAAALHEGLVRLGYVKLHELPVTSPSRARQYRKYNVASESKWHVYSREASVGVRGVLPKPAAEAIARMPNSVAPINVQPVSVQPITVPPVIRQASPAVVELRTDQIVRDRDVQARVTLDLDTVRNYSEALAEGVEFPPVLVYHDGEKYWLADGFHRHAAHQQQKVETIRAEVREGTYRDAVLYAVGANATHGLPRSNADKRRAVELLLRDSEWSKWSDREIARRAAVSQPFVSKRRLELSDNGYQIDSDSRLVTRNGTTYEQTTRRYGYGTDLEATKRELGIGPTPPATTLDDAAARLIAQDEAERAERAARLQAEVDAEIARRDAYNANPPDGSGAAMKLELEQLGIKPGYVMSHQDGTYTAFWKLKGLYDGEEYRLREQPAYEVIASGYQVEGPGRRNLISDSLPYMVHFRDLAPVEVDTPAAPAVETAVEQKTPQLFTSDSEEWYTPLGIIMLVRDTFGAPIELDPASCAAANRVVQASRIFTTQDDGLAQSWQSRTLFLNPPYGDKIGDFVQKLHDEYKAGHIEQAIALLPARTDTAWFQILADFPRCFVVGRLRFWREGEDTPNQATFPSAIVYLGADFFRFAQTFKGMGDVYTRFRVE